MDMAFSSRFPLPHYQENTKYWYNTLEYWRLTHFLCFVPFRMIRFFVEFDIDLTKYLNHHEAYCSVSVLSGIVTLRIKVVLLNLVRKGRLFWKTKYSKPTKRVQEYRVVIIYVSLVFMDRAVSISLASDVLVNTCTCY